MENKLHVLRPLLVLVLTVLFLSSCEEKTEDSIPENQFDINVINSFGSLLEIKLPQAIKASANSGDQLTEEEAKKLMAPIAEDSRQFLLDLGYTDSEIKEAFGEFDSPELTYGAISLFILVSSDYRENSQKSISVDEDFLSCIAQIIPIVAIAKLLDVGIDHYIEKHGKKALVKIIGKTLGKTLSWVGMAISGYELAVCVRDSIMK